MADPVNSFPNTQIARAAAGLYDLQLGEATMTQALAAATQSSVDAVVNAVFNRDFGSLTNAQVAAIVVKNVGISSTAGFSATKVADAETLVSQSLAAAAAGAKGATIVALLNAFAQMGDHAVYGGAAKAFNTQIQAATGWASLDGSEDTFVHTPPSMAGRNFSLARESAAGADVMRLKGDQDVRIDFTNPANQVVGLDYDGDGVIEFNGSERSVTDVAADYEIVDAYPRNPLNHDDIASNFLGDIYYDGTGFDGDGTRTDGNIVLGGLGVDTIFGGIGNDFLAGGGLAQGRAGTDALSGGRNADFFFAEFSAIDRTDGGPTLQVDGGNTADDNSAGNGQSAQDSDWLLFEASDDDEPVIIWLNDDNAGPAEPDGVIVDNRGLVLSRSGELMTIDDIENVDASGNLYGFLDDMDVQIGGRAVDGRDQAGNSNYGLGSSAQLDIRGSDAGNILIGGYDNDRIEGNGGADLLMGGNLKQLLQTVADGVTNPNLAGIVNDGRDELLGGKGNDNIVFEADGGVINGGDGTDTLWLTEYSLGTRSAATMLGTDQRLRFDLTSENGITEGLAAEGGAGYGGANSGTTADQTNYATGITGRVTVTAMENIDATGLGAIDYRAAGANSPELSFTNQQNFKGYNGDLQLLGTQGNNNLYAGAGNDEIHGRGGRDDMQGGAGNDDFYFALDGHFDVGGGSGGDSVDMIRAKVDANRDDLWDTTSSGANVWGQDFGLNPSSSVGTSVLQISIQRAGGNTSGTQLNQVVNNVSEIVTGVKEAGATTFTSIVLNSAAIRSAGTYADLTTAINAALFATPFGSDLKATLQSDGYTIFIADSKGRELADTSSEVPGAGVSVNQIANTATQNTFKYAEPVVQLSQDRIIYKSWEDRNDNEGVDDDTVLGSTMSLGRDAYAEDLVVSFQADGTRLAEDQSYTITFDNVTTQDKVTVDVNGVQYQLQVGVDLDGNIIAAEDGVGDAQVDIQTAFLARLADFITNSFADRNTVAGKVLATSTPTTLVLTQQAYNGEQTVFMRTPTVDQSASNQLSGGQSWTATVANNSQHEVLLFQFDGRENKLNETNVLFWGQEHVQRANLETAKPTGGELRGLDAWVIDGGRNDLASSVANGSLASVADNQSTNHPLAGLNFTVHGDDLLLSGGGVDQVWGGTGDDRIIGSTGSPAAPAVGATTGEILDGGKNVYAVQVLGESTARVYILNKWEARNPTLVADLNGLTISSITPVRDNENGLALSGGATVADTMFDDTLQFEQETFGASAAFTISLDDYTIGAGGVVQTRNDGAGLVWVDLNGNGVHDAGVDTYTRFTNFENIRTVSGTGKAVAGSGQGTDTLDATRLSSTVDGAGGVFYNLTGEAGAGEVRYSKDAIVTGENLGTSTGDRPAGTGVAVGDYEELVIKVDGVENVLTSTGHDLLVIDETEAAKDNRFSAGLGVDKIRYEDDFDAGAATVGQGMPSVTIKVNTSNDTDQVVMKGGRVGTLQTATGGAVDTLVGVEYLQLAGETAQSGREDDMIDVTAMVSGAVVDYRNGEVRTSGAAGTNVQLVIENIVQMERVVADGNDVVIVADSSIMAGNARSDEGPDATPAKNILFMTYLDFDQLVTDSTVRKSFSAQVLAGEITQVINQGQFSYSLSEVGAEADVDRVDYYDELDRIVVPVGQGAWTVPGAATNRPQYVVVDGNSDNVLTNLWSRVDALWGVEEIVASRGESVMDFTAVGAARQITFKYVAPSTNPAENQAVEQTIRIADGNGNTVAGLNAFVERYVYNKTTPAVADASWNRIEGSDAAEVVIYEGSEDLVNQAGLDHRFTNDVLTLRGGNNEVRYSPLETSISAVISVVDENTSTAGAAEGRITAVVQFQDGRGINAPSGTLLGGTHLITSHTSDNSTVAGSLKIEGSQDAEDVVLFAGLSSKTFLLGNSPGVIQVNLGAANSMVLTGFEFILDAPSNDIYNFASMAAATGLVLLDDATDHDVLQVGNEAAAGAFNGGIAGNTTIALNALNTYLANFDFDVLDISGVNLASLTTVTGTAGTDDELVIGVLGTGATTTVADFEAVVVSNAAIAAHGTSFVLNTTADSLVIGAKTLQFNGNMNTVSFMGTTAGKTGVASASTGVTVTMVGNESVTVWGSTAADNITTNGGNDTIRGGGGDDTISAGNGTGEVARVTFAGGAAIVAGGEVVTLIGAGGNTLTVGASGSAGELKTASATADADQIGALLNAQTTGYLETQLGYAPGSIASKSYDAASNVFTINFALSAGDVTNLTSAVTGGSTMTATSANTAPVSGGAETFVFEATKAANGTDTINNFDVNDTLNVSSFLGGATVKAAAAVNATAGLDLTGPANYGVVFNKGALAAADIATAAAAGKIAVEDGGKAVVLVTADADGVADSTNQAYDVYFIQDTNTSTTAQTWSVEKVATLNSVSELGAAEVLTGVVVPPPPPPGNTVTLPAGSTAGVTGTAAAEVFVLDVAAAAALTANTQMQLSGFATGNDSLRLNLPTASGVTTLAALNGQQGVTVQFDPFTGNTVVTLGSDADGDLIALTLVGVADASAVSVEVV